MRVFFLIPLVAVVSVTVGAQELCPRKINTTQSLAEEIDKYEVMLDDVKNSLSQVEFFYGHPSEMSSLMPDENVSKSNEEVVIWNFEEAKNIYVACGYTNTRVRLLKKADIYHRCTVIYDLTRQFSGGSYVLKNIICK